MAKENLASFVIRHPRCCFCGGERPTESRDHQPPRVWFREKRLPDGMVVPACRPCQEISRRAEAAIALSVLPQNHTGQDFEAWRKRIAFARNTYPNLIPQPVSSTREARTIYRRLGIRPPPGAFYRDIPLATLGSDEWSVLFDIVARKMTLAMHYRCFGQPLSRQGRLFCKLVPLAHTGTGDWVRELLDDLPNCEVGRHGSEDLGSQIMTRWNASKDGYLGFFMTQVQASFLVIGVTGESEEWRNLIGDEGSSAPFE